MTYNELSGMIIEAAIDIHRRLGPGLLESVYQTILAHELRKRGLDVRKEEPIPLVWDNIRFDMGFRADLIVNELILIELKSIEHIASVHKKQVLTYLKITGKKLGLLINFGDETLKDGISRIVNGKTCRVGVKEVPHRGTEQAEEGVWSCTWTF
jgi:GxxExxY protein